MLSGVSPDIPELNAFLDQFALAVVVFEAGFGGEDGAIRKRRSFDGENVPSTAGSCEVIDLLSRRTARVDERSGNTEFRPAYVPIFRGQQLISTPPSSLFCRGLEDDLIIYYP